MTKLTIKILITLFPMLTAIIFYIVSDPFEVIYKYSKHNNDPNIVYNRDYISVDLLKNSLNKKKFNSFVLGNSRSLAFTCADWTNYINNQGCFHFDASGESLYGIYKKMEWLDENSVKIKNALIVLDAETLASVKNSEGHLTIKHPDISKESIFDFQLEFIRAFLEPAFLAGYIDYKIIGKVRPIFYNYFEKRRFLFVENNNDVLFESAENEISEGTYYRGKGSIFYSRTIGTKYSDATIKSEQKRMLMRINEILNKNKSDFKIIISPLYNQLSINGSDVSELESIFGQNSVYNYSGINKYTNEIQNYYETSHYRRHVGKAILNEIYESNNK